MNDSLHMHKHNHPPPPFTYIPPHYTVRKCQHFVSSPAPTISTPQHPLCKSNIYAAHPKAIENQTLSNDEHTVIIKSLNTH